MPVSVHIDPATRTILGRGYSNDPGAAAQYVVVEDAEFAKLLAGPSLRATVDLAGVVTVVPAPAPPDHEETLPEVDVDLAALQSAITAARARAAQAKDDDDAALAPLAGAATAALALPHIRASLLAQHNALLALYDLVDALAARDLAIAQAARVLPPRRLAGA